MRIPCQPLWVLLWVLRCRGAGVWNVGVEPER